MVFKICCRKTKPGSALRSRTNGSVKGLTHHAHRPKGAPGHPAFLSAREFSIRPHRKLCRFSSANLLVIPKTSFPPMKVPGKAEAVSRLRASPCWAQYTRSVCCCPISCWNTWLYSEPITQGKEHAENGVLLSPFRRISCCYLPGSLYNHYGMPDCFGGMVHGLFRKVHPDE